jgi:hypothetical protein
MDSYKGYMFMYLQQMVLNDIPDDPVAIKARSDIIISTRGIKIHNMNTGSSMFLILYLLINRRD